MNVRFEILMVVAVKIIVFWDVAPCSLIDVYQLLCSEDGGSRFLYNVGKYLYQTAWCHNPEGANLHSKI
jgi:hypothetical protein